MVNDIATAHSKPLTRPTTAKRVRPTRRRAVAAGAEPESASSSVMPATAISGSADISAGSTAESSSSSVVPSLHEVSSATFESVVYDDDCDVVMCWKNGQRDTRRFRLLQYQQQGKLSFGHTCEILLASFQRLLCEQQQQRRAAPVTSTADSVACGERVRCVSFDVRQNPFLPTSNLWMDSHRASSA